MFNGKAPELLSNKLNYGVSTRTNKLEGGRSKGVYGDRRFSISGPKLWKLLPKDIRMEADTDEFKKKLKTFFFRELENPNSKF